MISNKEARAFLSKGGKYKITKKDDDSFQEILNQVPTIYYDQKDLIAKLVYISYYDYSNISSIFIDYIGYDNPFSFMDPDWSKFTEGRLDDNTYKYPIVSFYANSLEDAIYYEDIIPTIFYFKKKDIKKYKEGKEIIIDFKVFMKTFNETIEITETISRFVKKIRKDIDFMTENETYEEYEKKEYDNFIEELMQYSSKTPMLGSRRQQDFNFIKKLLNERRNIGRYTLQLIYINQDDLSKIIKKCSKGEDSNKEKITFKDPGSKIEINSDEFLDFSEKRPFFVYLTKSQIKKLRSNKITRNTHYLHMSYSHFHKTCFATILLNRDIYYYADYGKLPNPPKVKQQLPLLAIEMKNLIDFDKEPIQPNKTKQKPDLIPTSKTKPKPDLIPTSKTKQKPDLIPTSKTKQKPVNKLNEVVKKNLLDFTKEPYKQFTSYQSGKKINTEVINNLITEINYPLTKDIIGIKLTKELKEKISKLTNEAAIGLIWIIRALVESNKGKLNVYYANNNYYQLSKKQIKEIVEYYFTSLSLLLNPSQKK